MKSQRQYQRSLSKQRMKLSRYRLRGSTQRNGIAAIFCVRWFVTASRRAEAHAARPIHTRRSDQVGGTPSETATCSPCEARDRQATTPHTSTKAIYEMDHIQ